MYVVGMVRGKPHLSKDTYLRKYIEKIIDRIASVIGFVSCFCAYAVLLFIILF